VLGLLAAVQPLYAIGMAGGLAFLSLVMADLTVGVAMFTFVSFLEVIPGFGALSAAKLAGGVLVLSWIAASAMARPRRPQLAAGFPWIVAVGALFFTWTVLSLLWAEDGSATMTALQRYLPNLLLFPIVFSAVRTGGDVRLIVVAFVVGALLSTVYGAFIAPGDAEAAVEGRISGAGVDPNYLAASLVAGLAICGGTVATRGYSLVVRLAALLTILALFVALIDTASRTGLVALIAATAFAVVTAGRGRRLPAAVAIFFVLTGAATYITQAAPTEARERLSQVDASGTGRTDIWTVAVRVIRANPVKGVGAGNFIKVSKDYLLSPGAIKRVDFIVDDPKVAHNIYLEIWAELGIVGLLLFLSIVAFSLRSVLLAARTYQDLGDRPLELLARSVGVAMAGELTAAFFNSLEYEKTLWLIMSLGPALRYVSARRVAAAPSALA
jgi:putative inorganic carbon (hco3(-)) transporter